MSLPRVPARPAAVLLIAAAVLTTTLIARAQKPGPGGAAPLQAQTDEAADLLQRLFTSGEFTVRAFGPARWLEGGTAYTTIEPVAGQEGVFEIVRYATRTGERSVVVSGAQLTPAGANRPLVVQDYEWSADQKRLLIFTNSKPVWRGNTRGDYWVLDRTTHTLGKLGGRAAESTLLFAKFSPDGTRVGYVRQNNIYVEHLVTGTIVPLTRDGSATMINGTTDWVYEEELSLRDAFRWSPDGTAVAYWQFDTSGVRTFPLMYYTGKPRDIATGIPYPGLGAYPMTQTFPYPLAGTTNAAVRVGVVPAVGGATRWMQIPGDARSYYLSRMEWAGNSRELIVQQLNRKQNVLDLLVAVAATGAVRRIHREEDSAWVDYVTELRALDGGQAYLWESEASGWRHVYRVARDGSGTKAVTQGAYDVASVQSVDHKNGWLYFLASPETSTRRALYRTRLDGSGAPERLTPASVPGWHGYQISPDGAWAIHTYSRFNIPPVIDLVQLPDHRTVRTLEDNATARRSVAEVAASAVEFFEVPVGDGVTCDAWLLRPPDFDPTKKYPVLFLVYGGPWSQTVTDAWIGNPRKFEIAVTRAGYLVASVDTRGTPTLKGRAWRKVIYGREGQLLVKEHPAAVREMLRTRPYMDASRVAVWGWSTGGTSTLNLMFRAADVYKAGVAVASVPDMRLYDTIYTEKYMGLPQENMEGYRASAPINFAQGLQGKLLIVHGSGDDNVHLQGAELLVNRLIELGKPFDYFVYPNRSHAMSEGAGTTLHLHSLVLRFLRTHIPPGPGAQ
jgi:dipeptidyl-peptidase 4